MVNNLKNKKGLSYPEYIMGVFSTIILLIFLVFLFNILLSSCSYETTHLMVERSLNNLHKDSLYLFLVSPIDSPNPITPFVLETNFYKNNNLWRHNSLPLELSASEIEFQIKVDDINLINTIDLLIKPGQYSNVALLNGSLDNVLPIFEEINKHPDIITWDELTNDHNYLFVGCSAPLPTNKDTLKNWIINGGTLITTDYSIELIESLFGIEYVYSNKTSLRKDPIEISFKPDAKSILGLKGNHFVTNVFWVDISNKSTVLAEYKNIPDFELCRRTIDGCGEPVHYFEYGSGKVIHFSFHLDENEEIAKDFFNTFASTNQNAEKIFLYNELGDLIYESNNSIDIALDLIGPVNLIDQFNDCEINCLKNFIIKGDGHILLKTPIMQLKSRSIYSYNQISVADFLIYALSSNNKEDIDLIKDEINKYLDSISTGSITHRFTVSKKPQREDEIFNIISRRFRDNFFTSSKNKIEAEIELKLFNNESVYITLESGFKSETLLLIRLIPFMLPGGII
jgi:hypothetical protein